MPTNFEMAMNLCEINMDAINGNGKLLEFEEICSFSKYLYLDISCHAEEAQAINFRN